MVLDLFQLQPGLKFTLKGETYTVLDCFYRGSFSIVYKILSTENELLVMKVESKKGYNNNRTVLKLDAILLDQLQGKVGFAEMRAAARTEDFKMIVMQYVGPDFSQLQQLMPEQRFSIRTVIHIALNVLDRLETLHKLGWLHRDLKPGNLALSKDNVVFLLDFGMARNYLSDGQVRPLREVGPCCGTFEFTSLKSSYWQDMQPRDDLENWFFMTLHLLKGRLPWSGIANPSLVRDMKNWCMKERTRDVFGGISNHWERMYETITTAKNPLIPQLRHHLRTMLKEDGIDMTQPLDWEQTPALQVVMSSFDIKEVSYSKEIDQLGDGMEKEQVRF